MATVPIKSTAVNGTVCTMLPIALATLQRLEFPRKLGLMEMLYGRKLAARGTTWIQTSRGITWKLDLRDPCHRWIVYGYYEGPAIWRWLRGWLRDGDVVVDSGQT